MKTILLKICVVFIFCELRARMDTLWALLVAATIMQRNASAAKVHRERQVVVVVTVVMVTQAFAGAGAGAAKGAAAGAGAGACD